MFSPMKRCASISLWSAARFRYVNNLEIGHRRTAFEDFPEAQQKRLMVRLWLRNAGEPRYQG